MGLAVYVSLCLWSLCKILIPPNNFQISYPIAMKFLATYGIMSELSNSLNPVSYFSNLLPGESFKIHEV